MCHCRCIPHPHACAMNNRKVGGVQVREGLKVNSGSWFQTLSRILSKTIAQSQTSFVGLSSCPARGHIGSGCVSTSFKQNQTGHACEGCS